MNHSSPQDLHSEQVSNQVEDDQLVAVGRSLDLGTFAHRIIGKQFQRVVKQEKKVLADHDPEPVHQMRVGLRRLRTALTLFDATVVLPPPARKSRLRKLAQTLGRLRDLDVQMATLREEYHPQLNSTEQRLLDKDLITLQKQRQKAFAGTKSRLTQPSYKDLKAAYNQWLEHPRFQPSAQLPLLLVVPDLLMPLVAKLFLHPGWLIPVNHLSPENASILHDLRKRFKQVRYQTEFFTSFYSESFQTWVDELREVQERLGTIQDGQVLLDLLVDELHHVNQMTALQAVIHRNREEALSNWETLRQKYLNPEFRADLYQQLLALKPSSVEVR